MAVFVKSEPMKPQIKIHLKTPNIIKYIRARIKPIAKVLVVLGFLQLLSGIYGAYHVYNHGEGAHYHHYIHCQREIKMGVYTEYHLEFYLGCLILFAMMMKRPFWIVRLYVYLNWFVLAMSVLTLTCAYQHMMPWDLLLSGVIWILLHFIQICFGSMYCNLVHHENMMVRLVPLICRQRFIVKQIEMEQLHQTPEDAV